MALKDYLNTEFAVLDKTSVPDPMGGILYQYTEGARFMGEAVMNNTTEMRIAQQSGAKSVYTLVVDKRVQLERDQLIRRVSDQADFRLTTSIRDMTTPAKAGIQFGQASMERVIL